MIVKPLKWTAMWNCFHTIYTLCSAVLHFKPYSKSEYRKLRMQNKYIRFYLYIIFYSFWNAVNEQDLIVTGGWNGKFRNQPHRKNSFHAFKLKVSKNVPRPKLLKLKLYSEHFISLKFFLWDCVKWRDMKDKRSQKWIKSLFPQKIFALIYNVKINSFTSKCRHNWNWQFPI